MHPSDALDPPTLRSLCLAALGEADIGRKAALVRVIDIEILPTGSESSLTELPSVPGRPAHPLLVSPKELPQRSLGNVEGRAALIHALAHM